QRLWFLIRSSAIRAFGRHCRTVRDWCGVHVAVEATAEDSPTNPMRVPRAGGGNRVRHLATLVGYLGCPSRRTLTRRGNGHGWGGNPPSRGQRAGGLRGRGRGPLERGCGLTPRPYRLRPGRQRVRPVYARSPTYGCVVGFADGGVTVTVPAGLALVGKTASGDTFRRCMIPVQ